MRTLCMFLIVLATAWAATSCDQNKYLDCMVAMTQNKDCAATSDGSAVVVSKDILCTCVRKAISCYNYSDCKDDQQFASAYKTTVSMCSNAGCTPAQCNSATSSYSSSFSLAGAAVALVLVAFVMV